MNFVGLIFKKRDCFVSPDPISTPLGPFTKTRYRVREDVDTSHVNFISFFATRAVCSTASPPVSNEAQSSLPIHNIAPHIVPRGRSWHNSMTRSLEYCYLLSFGEFLSKLTWKLFETFLVLIVSSSTVAALRVHPKSTYRLEAFGSSTSILWNVFFDGSKSIPNCSLSPTTLMTVWFLLYWSPPWSHRWCIGLWCFSPSMSSASEELSTLEIALANILQDVLVLMSTLVIVLANILQDVLVLLNVGGCPSMQLSGLSLHFVFVCLLYDLLSFLFHCRLFIWNQHCLGWKIFYSYFSVSRGMRLWETDLQSLLNHT